jgi:hypothetical protein
MTSNLNMNMQLAAARTQTSMTNEMGQALPCIVCKSQHLHTAIVHKCALVECRACCGEKESC